MGTALSKVREWLESVIAHVLRNPMTYKVVGVTALLAIGWTWAILADSGRGVFVMIIAVIVGVLAILRIVRGPMDPSTDHSLPPAPDPGEISARVKRSITKKETVLFEEREHPIGLWKEALVISVAQGALVLFISQGAWKLGLLIWIACMVWAGWRIAEWRYAVKICVTPKRLLVTSGLIAPNYGGMYLQKMTDRTVQYSTLSLVLTWLRIIDRQYGTVRVESAGQDQAIDRIVYVPDGYRFSRLITECIG